MKGEENLENEFNFNSKKYKAIKKKDYKCCTSLCAFVPKICYGNKEIPYCDSVFRKDGRDVYFVEAED